MSPLFDACEAAVVSPSQQESSSTSRATIPAWGASFALHVSFLVAILLFNSQTVISKRITESEVPASIVLAANNTNGSMQYFGDESADSPIDRTEAPPLLPSTGFPAESSGGRAPSQSDQRELPALLPQRIARSGDTALLPSAATFGSGYGSGRGIPSVSDGKAEADFIAREQQKYRVDAPSGPTTTVSLFGSPAAEGRSFAFVLDRSASTGAEGLGVLESAEKQLIAVVNSLAPTQRFQIIAYNERTQFLGPRQMVLATEENKTLLPSFFQALAAYGATNHEMGLKAALRAKPDVIFLLTDGGDPFLTAGELREVLEMAGRTTSIHCIQFGVSKPLAEGEAFMKKLSGATGGSYTFLDVDKLGRSLRHP